MDVVVWLRLDSAVRAISVMEPGNRSTKSRRPSSERASEDVITEWAEIDLIERNRYVTIAVRAEAQLHE